MGKVNKRILSIVMLILLAAVFGVMMILTMRCDDSRAEAALMPVIAEPGREMSLEEFLDSGEVSAIRHIDYWFNYRKYELASGAQEVERILGILRESTYKQTDTRDVPNAYFCRFELATDTKRYLLGVTEDAQSCIAFGGNQYIADQNIFRKMTSAEGLAHIFVDSEGRERAAVARVAEKMKMLTELLENGAEEEITEIDCWKGGSLYRLTEDPETIRWFMEALRLEKLTKLAEEDFVYGFPELDLEVVAESGRYCFSVEGPYLYIGQSQFMDDGKIDRKIREVGNKIGG